MFKTNIGFTVYDFIIQTRRVGKVIVYSLKFIIITVMDHDKIITLNQY